MWTGVSSWAAKEKLSALGESPDWKQLDVFQRTMTYGEFKRLLTTVYAPNGAWKETIQLHKTHALILKKSKDKENWKEAYRLEFGSKSLSEMKSLRYWRMPSELSVLSAEKKPLEGVKIAIDPGHLGGKWAKMEERWFQLGEGIPVTEGDMALLVSKKMATALEKAGAEVFLVRDSSTPVTRERPHTLEKKARKVLKDRGIQNPKFSYRNYRDPKRYRTVKGYSELLFYRVSEIRKRAEKINKNIKPDLTLCVHFNAEAWGNPASPQLTQKNHFHLLINGTYSAGEMSHDDQRFEMLKNLLGRIHQASLKVSKSVRDSVVRQSGLPPFIYRGSNARVADDKNYIWRRNLLANRLFECPVVYLEPYVMNSKVVYDRVQLGDYEGMKMVHGKKRKSLYREYADSVVEGVIEYYRKNRK